MATESITPEREQENARKGHCERLPEIAWRDGPTTRQLHTAGVKPAARRRRLCGGYIPERATSAAAGSLGAGSFP